VGIRELNDIRDDDHLQHLRLRKVLRAEIRAVDGEVYSLCVEAVVLPKSITSDKTKKANEKKEEKKKSKFSMVAQQRRAPLSRPTRNHSH
jgi:hypothetical protein